VAPENKLGFIRPNQDVSREAPDRKSAVSKRTLAFVENDHTVPAVGTLEVLAEALGTPLEQLLNEDGQAPSFPNLPNRLSCDDIVGLKRRK
jgi:transcriptional regulator with XRE-family HTH domain